MITEGLSKSSDKWATDSNLSAPNENLALPPMNMSMSKFRPSDQ